MGDVATPHRTRPVEVLITEPLTTANRGETARWLEDQGITVGVPAQMLQPDGDLALIVDTRHDLQNAHLGERVVVVGRTAEVIDQAHYKLWYEPIERTEP